MAYAATEQGYQKKLYVGTIGSTAGNLWEQVTDIDHKLTPKKGSQTRRGTSSAPPLMYEAVTQREFEASWTVLNGTTADSNLVAVLAAIMSGDAFALKIVDADGTVRFDGDVISPAECAAPLDKEGTYKFTATPSYVTRAASVA
jgi:hypothetical protein